MTSSPSEDRPTCFIAMPMSTQAVHLETYAGDPEHWRHVMESLFEKAILLAGYTPVRPAVTGSFLIHGAIIEQLSTADLVLVDLSSHNPNVFFEFGVRTSLNLPISLVRDEHTSLPFDTAGINTYSYDSKLNGWNMDREVAALAEHLANCATSCAGENPLWRQFGLTIRAGTPNPDESPFEAKVDLLASRLEELRRDFDRRMPTSVVSDSNVSGGAALPFVTLNSSAHSWVDQVRGRERLSTINSDLDNFSAELAAEARNKGFAYELDMIGPRDVVLHLSDQAPVAFYRRAEKLGDMYRLNLSIAEPNRGNLDSDG